MKSVIISGVMLALTVGLPAVGAAGPGSGQPIFGTRSRAALARNLEQPRPFALTGMRSDEGTWRLEKRTPTSTKKRASSFVYERSHDGG